MIRFIFVVIFLILFLLASIPIQLVLWLIGKKWPMARDMASLRIVQWAFKVIIFFSGTKLTVIGEENVPEDEPVLYIGNHRSYFDIVLTYARCPRRTGYVAKKEMDRYPVLNNWMRFLHCRFLDRQDIRQGLQVILAAIEEVKQGISICIFPEGTRGEGENELDMLPFHDASFKVAQRSGCAIIPMALTNTADIFEAHVPKIKKTSVILEYGSPIYLNELSPEDRRHPGEYVRNVIGGMLEAHRSL